MLQNNNVKGQKGFGIDGFFARMYDKTAKNYIMDQYKIWAHELLKVIPQNATLLEIAPGPGYLAIELAKAGIKSIAGLDISESLVEISKKNALNSNVSIDFLLGDASQMQFSDNLFSHIICTSAFKNFSAPLSALNEMYRVLKPRGTLWLCDMRKNVSNSDIDVYTDTMLKLKGFNSLITKITFKYMLRKRAYTKESMLNLVSKTSFKVVKFEQNIMEFYITLAK